MSSGADVPSRITKASAQKTAIPRMNSTLRESNGGSSSRTTGTARQRQASIPALNTRKPSRSATSQLVMPRSTKEWTEKSARIPDRVRNVPYRIVRKATHARIRFTRRWRLRTRCRNMPCTRAAVKSHGTRLVFSTGSHPQ